MNDIDANAVFRAIEGNDLNQVADGYVIYQPSRERVHYLNPTAVVVYELCAAGKPVHTVESVLQDAFGLAEKPTEAVYKCIRSLLDEGLLSPCPPSSSAP
jgi:hypothetical protein